MFKEMEDTIATPLLSLTRLRSHLPIKRLFRYALSLLGAGTIIWLLLRQIGIYAIWELLIQVEIKWFLSGLGWYFFTNICRAYRFGVLLSWHGTTRPLRLIPDMIGLSFLNNVLPARAGELLFPLLLRQRHHESVSKSLAALLLARIFDFLAVTVLFLVVTFLMRAQITIKAQQMTLVAIIILTPALFLLVTLPWLGQRGITVFIWFTHHLGVANCRLSQSVYQMGMQMVTAVTRIRQIRTYLKIFFWSCLGWLGTFAWFGAFLQAVALPMPYSSVVMGATFATLSKAIPFATFSGFGMHEAGWAFGFHLVGMAWETAVVSGFAVNILTLLVSLMSGIVVFWLIWLASSSHSSSARYLSQR